MRPRSRPSLLVLVALVLVACGPPTPPAEPRACVPSPAPRVKPRACPECPEAPEFVALGHPLYEAEAMWIYVFKSTETLGTCGKIEPYFVTIPITSRRGGSWDIVGLKCKREKDAATFRCDGNHDDIVGMFKGDDDEIIEATENATRVLGRCTSTWKIEGRKVQRVPWEP